MSLKQTLPFSSLKSLLLLLASSLFSFLLLSTITFTHNFVVCNRYPFGLLVKFKLWNLTVFKISIVFQRLSANDLFLQRSWSALASQSCPSQDRRGIRNVPITELQLVKRRFLGSWKRQFKTKSNKQTSKRKRNEKQTNKQKKKDLWGLWMAKKSRATLWTNKILDQNRCRLVAAVVTSLDLFFFF